MNSALKISSSVLLASAFAPAASAVVPWTTPSGSTILFNYDAGETDNGLMGDPTVVGTTFNFSPPNFIATSANPGFGSAQDTLTVFLDVNPGQTITGFRITEFGTHSVDGITLHNGTLLVTDITGNSGLNLLNPPLVYSDTGPNQEGSVDWVGSVDLMLPVNFVGGDRIQLQLTNNMTAVNGGWRQKEGVIIEILPTPGSVGAMGFALALLGGRRRR